MTSKHRHHFKELCARFFRTAVVNHQVVQAAGPYKVCIKLCVCGAQR
jgi:hypothetical protein